MRAREIRPGGEQALEAATVMCPSNPDAGLKPRQLLTAEVFRRARRRLDALPVASRARLQYEPFDAGLARVDAVISERPVLPRGWVPLAIISVRACGSQLGSAPGCDGRAGGRRTGVCRMAVEVCAAARIVHAGRAVASLGSGHRVGHGPVGAPVVPGVFGARHGGAGGVAAACRCFAGRLGHEPHQVERRDRDGSFRFARSPGSGWWS